jgi:predicted SAM-dependent methyltransferase
MIAAPPIMPSRESLGAFVAARADAPVRLHLGCGGVKWRDFINVDMYPHDDSRPDGSRTGCVADVFADMRRLDLPDDTIDEIFSAHTIEHFTRWEAMSMLGDWHRMMKPGARLVLETPDFARCVLWLFHPQGWRRALARKQFYGNQWDGLDYETHRYVWSARELRAGLVSLGFRSVTVHHRTATHCPGRDMQAVAVK